MEIPEGLRAIVCSYLQTQHNPQLLRTTLSSPSLSFHLLSFSLSKLVEGAVVRGKVSGVDIIGCKEAQEQGKYVGTGT